VSVEGQHGALMRTSISFCSDVCDDAEGVHAHAHPFPFGFEITYGFPFMFVLWPPVDRAAAASTATTPHAIATHFRVL